MGLWQIFATARGELDADLARAAWQDAEAEGDDNGLVALAVRAELPAELVDAARTHRRAAVRGGWLARSDHETAALIDAIRAEKANGALTVAARHAKGPQVIAALALWGNHSTAAEVIQRAGLPREGVLAAWRALAAKWDAPQLVTPRNARARTYATLRHRSDCHREFAMADAPIAWVAEVAKSPALGATEQLHLLDRAWDAWHAGDNQPASAVRVVCALIEAGAADATVKSRVEMLLAAMAADTTKCRSLGGPVPALLHRAAQRGCQLRRVGAAAAGSSERAAESADPDELRSLAAKAAATGGGEVARYLANNQHTPVDALAAILLHLDWQSPVAAVLERIVEEDEELAVATVAADPSCLNRVDAPVLVRHLAGAIARRWAETGEVVDERRWKQVMCRCAPPLEVALCAPWPALCVANDKLRGEVAAWLAEQLDGDGPVYQMVDGIAAASPEMRVRDLVEAARLVA